jgi:hypothetical protein
MKFGQLVVSASAGQTRMRLGLLILATSLALVACGGGGGGTATVDVASTGIVDSFGRNVGGGDSSGVGAGDSGADGSAGDGAPIVGGKVVVTDSTGKTVTATTDANGYYRVKVTGFTPPFVAKVTRTDGVVRYSLNVKPIKTNGFVTVNITGLTDKIASDVAVAGGKTGASQLTPQIVAANPAAITKSIGDLRTLFGVVITKAGLTVETFDPLSVPFVTNRTGYDNVLDNAIVTVAANGATQLGVAATYVAPAAIVPVTQFSTLVALQGTWSQVNSSSPSFATTVTGAEVPPSQAALTDFYWVSTLAAADSAKQNAQNPGYTQSYSNIVMTSTGFNFSSSRVGTGVNAGTSYVFATNLSFSNYVGCGNCGVGSVVSFVMSGTNSGTYTTGGVLTDMPLSAIQTSTVSFQRKT